MRRVNLLRSCNVWVMERVGISQYDRDSLDSFHGDSAAHQRSPILSNTASQGQTTAISPIAPQSGSRAIFSGLLSNVKKSLKLASMVEE